MRKAMLWSFVGMLGFVIATPFVMFVMDIAEISVWMPAWWTYGLAQSLAIGAIKVVKP